MQAGVSGVISGVFKVTPRVFGVRFRITLS